MTLSQGTLKHNVYSCFNQPHWRRSPDNVRLLLCRYFGQEWNVLKSCLMDCQEIWHRYPRCQDDKSYWPWWSSHFACRRLSGEIFQHQLDLRIMNPNDFPSVITMRSMFYVFLRKWPENYLFRLSCSPRDRLITHRSTLCHHRGPIFYLLYTLVYDQIKTNDFSISLDCTLCLVLISTGGDGSVNARQCKPHPTPVTVNY